ncbi:LysR substrate-binding domain-containing protein [Xylophilus sp. GOD-11R]|uniref:LysR substrate-binding domain-containing protein n=1 Tax=Xylophilus sp. GOD-11R TaxID=3089814 RepID=UPI00298C6DB9|nr:LysR substrate-binding domain-containing protein [Xylophilus sp. GOD-11R]WPB57462.1 LysR substrate-binding domain-containing protein [Xylophilus sp. GOD-11R]
MDQLLALRVFVRIAETGGFSKAADQLNIPRPTVTKLVQDLEQHLGTRLLRRTTRRVQVTAEGSAYYERARRVVAEVEEMDQQAGGSRTQLSGRLRVDVGSVVANRILLPALARFRERHPGLRLELGVSDRPIDLVGDGVDCAIRGGELPDNRMVARRLASLGWVTCASADYLHRHGEPRHPDELAARADGPGGHALVGYFSSLSGRAFPLEFQRGGESILVPPDAGVLCNESTAHVQALACGLGLGQTFRFAAERHLADGSLRELLADWSRPAQTFSLVYPGGRDLSAKIRAFSDWAAELFAPLDAGRPASTA